MSPEQAREFLDSLEPENGLPDNFYRLLNPRTEFYKYGDEILSVGGKWSLVDELWVGQHVLPHVISRRAESRQIPDLKERVKELVRDAMDAENRLHTDKWTDHTEWKQYFDMCSPEVKP